MSDTVDIRVNGVIATVDAGTSVTVALLNAGIPATRRSVRGEPRGPVCGMGVCHECRVTIDGVFHQRGCLIPIRAGMDVITDDVSAR